MNGTGKGLLDNRAVYFTEQIGGPLRLDADHDAVRMQKIFDRRTFPEKFRIGSNVVVEFAGTVHR